MNGRAVISIAVLAGLLSLASSYFQIQLLEYSICTQTYATYQHDRVRSVLEGTHAIYGRDFTAAICIAFVLKHTPCKTNQHYRLRSVLEGTHAISGRDFTAAGCIAFVLKEISMTVSGQCSRVPMPSLAVTLQEQTVITVTGMQALYGL